MPKTTRSKDYGHGLHAEYSPPNQAYFLMWMDQVLRILPTLAKCDDVARDWLPK